MGNCVFCGASLQGRMNAHNVSGHAFVYLKKDESSHIECYIHKCVEEALKQKKEEK